MDLSLLLTVILAGGAFAAPSSSRGDAHEPKTRSSGDKVSKQQASGSKTSAKPARNGPPSKEELAANIDTGVLTIKKEQKGKDKTVRLKTTDGWWIVFTYRAPRKGGPVAVLAHGFGSGRAEWGTLLPGLHKRGWGTLAFDLRGHGDSQTGPVGKVDFTFIDAKGAWPDAVRDFDLALRYLREQKIPGSRTCLVGASLGANLASIAAAGHPDLACAVLLSPGRNYRGAALNEDPAPKVRTLVAASPEDAYAYQSLVGFRARSGKVTLLEGSRGHGVAMLADADFHDDLLAWLDSSVKR